MSFFIGNSFCNLCQTNEEQLEKELVYCTFGLREKGLLPVKKGFNSARLPSSDKFSIAYFENSSWDENVKFHKIDTNNDLNKNNYLSKIKSIYKFELQLHKTIYELRPDVNAICHTRNHYSIISFEDDTIKKVHGEATLILGDIPVINRENYKLNIEDELLINKITDSSLGEPLRPIRTIVIKKNSVLGLGACVHESRAFVEILEECAKFYIFTKIFNGPLHVLKLDQLRSLGSRYARSIKFGGRQEQISNKNTSDVT